MFESLIQRTVIIGNSGAGKSALAESLAASIHVPVIDLDLLNWEGDSYGRLPERASQHLLEPIHLDGPQRHDCVAGHVRLELRNVVAKYPLERSLRFVGIQPNSGHRDYSRLSCGDGDTQLGPSARISAGMLARALVNR